MVPTAETVSLLMTELIFVDKRKGSVEDESLLMREGACATKTVSLVMEVSVMLLRTGLVNGVDSRKCVVVDKRDDHCLQER